MPRRERVDATAIHSRSDATQKKLERKAAAKLHPPPKPPAPPPVRSASTRRACDDDVSDARHRGDVDGNEQQLDDCEPTAKNGA